jgi:hypothetical protein
MKQKIHKRSNKQRNFNNNNNNKTAAKITEELNQPNEKSDSKQEGIQHTKARLGEVLKNKWKNKIMHEQHIRNRDRQLISEEDKFLWISKGDLKVRN